MTTYKSDLIRLTHKALKGSVSLNILNSVTSALLKTILVEAMKGNKISITGFGKFYKKNHKGTSKLSGDFDTDTIAFKLSRRVKDNMNLIKEHND